MTRPLSPSQEQGRAHAQLAKEIQMALKAESESLITALDIEDVEDVDTAVLVILDPRTQAPTTSTITLASKEHPARKKIDLAKTRRFRTEFVRKGKMPNQDPLEEIGEETDYLVASTLGWSIISGGKELPFSPEAARKLYEDPKRQWLRTQVLDAINKNELFIKDSVKA